MCSQLHSVSPQRASESALFILALKNQSTSLLLFIIFHFFALSPPEQQFLSHHAFIVSLLQRVDSGKITVSHQLCVRKSVLTGKFAHLIYKLQEKPPSEFKKSVKHGFSPSESRGHLRRTGCICFFSGLHTFFLTSSTLPVCLASNRLEVLLNSKNLVGW